MITAGIYTEGGGGFEYIIECWDDNFSIKRASSTVELHHKPLFRYKPLDVITRLLHIINKDKDPLFSLVNQSYSDWGIKGTELLSSNITFKYVQEELFPFIRHSVLCQVCGGQCCKEIKTCSCYDPDKYVGPLRFFELPLHDENKWEWKEIDRDSSESYDYVEHTGVSSGRAVPMLKKEDGKCVYAGENGCTAEYKPLMCSQFSCVESSGIPYRLGKKTTREQMSVACSEYEEAHKKVHDSRKAYDELHWGDIKGLNFSKFVDRVSKVGSSFDLELTFRDDDFTIRKGSHRDTRLPEPFLDDCSDAVEECGERIVSGSNHNFLGTDIRRASPWESDFGRMMLDKYPVLERYTDDIVGAKIVGKVMGKATSNIQVEIIILSYMLARYGRDGYELTISGDKQ